MALGLMMSGIGSILQIRKPRLRGAKQSCCLNPGSLALELMLLTPIFASYLSLRPWHVAGPQEMAAVTSL